MVNLGLIVKKTKGIKMSDPIASAQQKINIALKLLFEAQRLLDAQIDATQPIQIDEDTEDKEDLAEGSSPTDKRQAIQSLFQAILENPKDDDVIMRKLSSCMHSSVASNKHALASIIRFNWTRLCNQKSDYLKSTEDPNSFSIVREQSIPNQPTETVKVFLQAGGRNPTPCTLQKENNGNWKILTFSL